MKATKEAAMNRPLKRTLQGLLGAALAAAVVLALLPRPIPVEIASASRGAMKVEIQGSGRTRVKQRFVVLAPASGSLERIPLRAGDEVEAGRAVAWIVPALPSPIDSRTRAEASARVAAAASAEAEARAQLERAKVALGFARQEESRALALASSQAVSRQAIEQARFQVTAHEKDLALAETSVERARREVVAYQALLGPVSGGKAGGDRLPVPAPAKGLVLRVLRDSEGPVAMGTPLLEVGSPSDLEAVLDLLTSQAARIRVGSTAMLERWGGPEPLRARVSAIEPSGFTKVSALGVEEQRVNVILEPIAPEGWQPLGDGYHVEGRILVHERADALKVPAGALFRLGGEWATYRVESGKAVVRTVKVGESDGEAVEILEGLAEGDRVVVHPSDKVSAGVAVEVS
jgi:HlyD family secretion protein